MYRAAEALAQAGLAYVDEQSADQIRANRGDFTTPGTNSPFRDRTPDENVARLREMRDGKHADGAMVLRAKIDMASPNINLRDPALYRIRRAHHHSTGDRWCIYPMYTFAHPIEDALERITHSICTLEFEDQRPFYDWLLERLVELGLLSHPLPKQYEFARLNLTYVVTSKRKLRQLVEENHVERLGRPAHAHARRHAPPRLHAGSAAAAGRAHRRHQEQHLDRLRLARHRAARRPRGQGAARDGRARPDPAQAHQLGRRVRRRGHRAVQRAGASAPSGDGPARVRARPARCGSSATTSSKCRPRATSACSRATRCA